MDSSDVSHRQLSFVNFTGDRQAFSRKFAVNRRAFGKEFDVRVLAVIILY